MNFMPQPQQGFPPAPGQFGPPGFPPPPQGQFGPPGFPPPPQGQFGPPQGFQPQGPVGPQMPPQDNFAQQYSAPSAPQAPNAASASSPQGGADPMGLDNMSDEEFAKMLQEIMGGSPGGQAGAPAGAPPMGPAAMPMGPQAGPQGEVAPQQGGLMSKILGNGAIVKSIGYGVAALGMMMIAGKKVAPIGEFLGKLPVLKNFYGSVEKNATLAEGTVDDIGKYVKERFDELMQVVKNNKIDNPDQFFASVKDDAGKFIEDSRAAYKELETVGDDAAKKSAIAKKLGLDNKLSSQEMQSVVDEQIQVAEAYVRLETDLVSKFAESSDVKDKVSSLLANSQELAESELKQIKETSSRLDTLVDTLIEKAKRIQEAKEAASEAIETVVKNGDDAVS